MAEHDLKALGTGEIRLRVHGLERGQDSPVPASVFAQKLGSLVRALRAADRAVNGKVKHDYIITALKTGSAVVELQEQPILPPPATLLPPLRSGVDALEDCVQAIRFGSVEEARMFGNCSEHIRKLAQGSGHRFGFAELWVDKEEPIRVDEILLEQSVAVIEGPKVRMLSSPQQWYRGIAHGAFDGVVKEVDLRGALPEVKLVLTAGGREIGCVLRSVEIDDIREVLDRRVRVEGAAYYDGKSGLPRRLEVSRIKTIKEPGDFMRWKGAFDSFTPPEWEDDGERQ